MALLLKLVRSGKEMNISFFTSMVVQNLMLLSRPSVTKFPSKKTIKAWLHTQTTVVMTTQSGRTAWRSSFCQPLVTA